MPLKIDRELGPWFGTIYFSYVKNDHPNHLVCLLKFYMHNIQCMHILKPYTSKNYVKDIKVDLEISLVSF